MRDSYSTVITAPPDAVFKVITDIDAFPEWNTVIRKVVERPNSLVPGAEWVVEIHAMGATWPSRSRVEEFDAVARIFQYRTQTDDGNPSYTAWRWEVAGASGGSTVTVSWDVNPKTFWRKVLFSKIRGRQLREELPASIDAIAARAGA